MELILVVVGAIVVTAIAHRRGLEPALIIVMVGIAVSFAPDFEPPELDSHILLTVVLPPLLYSAALNFSFPTFLRNIRPILGLGVGLVVISAYLIFAASDGPGALAALGWGTTAGVLVLALATLIPLARLRLRVRPRLRFAAGDRPVILTIAAAGLVGLVLIFAGVLPNWKLPIAPFSYVETGLWGGIPVTIILATYGLLFAFPYGILLALGRHQDRPAEDPGCQLLHRR